MGNQQRHSIALQHNRVFRFSCSLDYKSPLQMALLYTHPKHWHINVDNLTMTPSWNFSHRTLKVNFTLCKILLVEIDLRMACLCRWFRKAKKNSKWKRITCSVWVIKVQFSNLAQFTILNFADLKLYYINSQLPELFPIS